MVKMSKQTKAALLQTKRSIKSGEGRNQKPVNMNFLILTLLFITLSHT